ncbi:proline-rich protein 36 [Triticum aestivum]|uniref:proline-rich protein 36 n=1 Tax=Triticum aestivum TaxID=4565 RepID=UPI001D01743B|nr:proline-rich protein 36-like [Triticum aestivum]
MLVFHARTGEELPILVSKASSSPLLEPPPAAVAGDHPQDPIVPITFLLLARFLLPASHLSPVSLDRRRATMSAAKFLPGATPPGSGCLRVVRAPASPLTRLPSLPESQQPRLLPCFTKFIAARAPGLLQRPMASAAPELCCSRRQQQQLRRRLPPLFPCARPPNPIALRLHRALVPEPRGPRRPADPRSPASSNLAVPELFFGGIHPNAVVPRRPGPPLRRPPSPAAVPPLTFCAATLSLCRARWSNARAAPCRVPGGPRTGQCVPSPTPPSRPKCCVFGEITLMPPSTGAGVREYCHNSYNGCFSKDLLREQR